MKVSKIQVVRTRGHLTGMAYGMDWDPQSPSDSQSVSINER